MTARRAILVSASLLVLPAAVAGLWARSHWVADRVDYQRDEKLYSVVTHGGTLQFVHVDRKTSREYAGFGYQTWPVREGDDWWDVWNRPVSVKQWFGFGVVRGTYYRLVGVPLWVLLMLAVSPPYAWLRRSLKRLGRERAGLCRRCGYDLRASPERCPECGAMSSGGE